MTAEARAGWMKHGNARDNALNGSADSDVFFGGAGNDTFRNGNGRDCAVYGKEKWGQDTITKTAGTLALVFKDLKKADVVQTLKGTTMTLSKKADASQKITVAGWDSARHSIVFGGTMSAFNAWAKVTSPTAAQATAARTEVWKKAGLTTA